MPRIPGLLVLRLILLLGLLLGAKTYVFVSIYRTQLRETGIPRLADAVSAELRTVRYGLPKLSAAERQEWFAQFNLHGDISIVPIGPDSAADSIPSSNPFLKQLENNIRQQVGDDVRVTMKRGSTDGSLLVDFDIDGRRYRVTLPGSGYQPGDLWPFTQLMLFNAVIIAFGAAFAVWQISRPLQKTAAMLARSANQLVEIDMPSTAPRELQVFAERFNSLVHQLRAQEQERALLLAGASHDLRAPLTRIRLNAEVMDEDSPGSGSRILSDADSMRHIIDQFMDFYRGTNPSQVTLIDLGLVVTDTVQHQRQLGCDIRLQQAPSLAIAVDPTAVDRILNNLIDNALAYGAEPVEISLTQDDGWARLEIRDHGTGIAEKEIDRLLQPFERLDAARSLQGHCGLGLAIVDRLIKESGGTLSLSNHPEGGLRVCVRLPLAACDAAGMPTATASASATLVASSGRLIPPLPQADG